MARPRPRWHDEPKSDLPTLAAAYGSGLGRDHPFRDGNKRVAFVAMVVFLELNGWTFAADEVEVVTAMVALAEEGLSEKDLATWLRTHSNKSPKR